MNVVYYRDSDGSVIGSTSSPGNVDTQMELTHWGAGVSALEVDSLPFEKFKKLKVAGGVLSLVDDTDALAKKQKNDKDRADGIAKLKVLGLTDDQIKALIR